MILAIIFLLTDLFICGITYMVYGRKPVYSDGMILEFIYEGKFRKNQNWWSYWKDIENR